VTDAVLVAELDEQVWEPFRAAYAARDTAAYLALHEPGLIRAGGPGRVVQSYGEVAAEVGSFFAGARERDLELAIDVRFAERLADGDLASERGVTRIRVGADVFFGRFHTFCRRVDGRWRIAVDYDTDEGADEAAFVALG
jgi:ketosteroid isomerase-like protein